jgi:hypothetical protein
MTFLLRMMRGSDCAGRLSMAIGCPLTLLFPNPPGPWYHLHLARKLFAEREPRSRMPQKHN